MKTALFTLIAVVVGMWIYGKLNEERKPAMVPDGNGFRVDPVTGVELAPGNQPGTVGFVSGPVDNFAGPGDGAVSNPNGMWGVKYE